MYVRIVILLYMNTNIYREEQLGPNHSRVGQTLKHMITLYEMQERFKEAEECGERYIQMT